MTQLPESDDEPQRVIILGFDGVDPGLVRQFMREGQLPHLAELAQKGSFKDLATTNPAESPVSWAAFSVGSNPGKTGIFDFLRRTPDSYIPDIALVDRTTTPVLPATWMRVGSAAGAGVLMGLTAVVIFVLLARILRRKFGRRLILTLGVAVWAITAAGLFVALEAWVPRALPRVENARRGIPFWELAGHGGHASCVLQVPVTFPAQGFPHGRLLTGLGTPDIRGTWGTYSIYAESFPEIWSDPVNELGRDLYIDGTTDSVTGGKVVHVEFPDGDQVETTTVLFGPRDFTITPERRKREPDLIEDLQPELRLRLDRAAGTATFASGGAEVAARAGEWTDWLELEFKLNPLFAVKGIVRFHLRSVRPFYAYASPINFHPAAPPFLAPLSAPADYSREITERTKHLHETVGWAIATNPLKDELINEDEFLSDARFTFDNRWRVIRNELEHGDWKLLVGVTMATDRVQHMFWRYLDPTHPLHEANAPDRFKNAILETYRRMDEVVGETMEKFVDDETALWVISDHGFASFKKGVHINSWLVEEGLMTLHDPTLRERGKLADITRAANPFANVDWSRTRAYSLGLGKIYLNRKGREPEGIIETDSEAEEVMDRIIGRFEAFRDPDDGGRVVHRVYRSRDIFTGPYARDAADLVVGFEKGYRVSWDTATGRAPPGVIEVNRNKWSGDHCSVDPGLVPGVVFSNCKIALDDPSIIDMGRTVLLTLGVDIPAALEGRDLLQR